MSQIREHQGSVRAHLKRTPLQRLWQAWHTRSLAECGSGAFVDRGVEFLRYPENVWLGADTIVKAGARICPANSFAEIRIGEWSTIGYHTHLFATTGIEIGTNCLIAPFCYLVDANHGLDRHQLIREQPMRTAPIAIGDDVWLGAGATVLAGVTIGTGAVVAAGSIVNQDIEAYAIVAGSPARKISERMDPDAV